MLSFLRILLAVSFFLHGFYYGLGALFGDCFIECTSSNAPQYQYKMVMIKISWVLAVSAITTGYLLVTKYKNAIIVAYVVIALELALSFAEPLISELTHNPNSTEQPSPLLLLFGDLPLPGIMLLAMIVYHAASSLTRDRRS